MKYLSYIKRNQFVQALAILPPRFRYITARRRWYAARLGLYCTILQYKSSSLFQSRRNFLVNTIAGIKLQKLTHSQARESINHILYSKGYSRFRNELIKEVVSSYPEVIFGFLKDNMNYSDNSYYQGLYIALQYSFDKSASLNESYFKDMILNQLENDYVDKRCLFNNIVLHSALTKLNNLNEILFYQNISTIDLINKNKLFTVTNLKSVTSTIGCQEYGNSVTEHKVTVIVTSYNASKTIVSCINSLLDQTWPNVEIIVVDDNSTDNTLKKLRQLKKQCNALKIISLPYNVGTFAAKNIGAQYATGEFLTCQDSDDWAHPQKIAEQLKPLIKDSRIIATTSQWLRLDNDGQYYVRQIYPFMRQNPASPMFRLKLVRQNMGLWHAVRTGADSEFYERLKVFYGNDSIIAVKKILTIASHRSSSLMNSDEFGIHNSTAALARLEYWELWRLWHISVLHNKKLPYMPTLYQQAQSTKLILDSVPNSIKVDTTDLKRTLKTHKLLSVE